MAKAQYKPQNQPENEQIPVFPMRINKYIAWKGHSTRRGADILIQQRQIFINDRLAVLGDKVKEGDVVEFRYRGKKAKLPEENKN